MPLSSRFPALASRSFARYLAGGFISNVGNTLQAAAIAWHVWVLTGSSAMVGVLGLVRVGPLLIFSLFGGVLADQIDRRKVMLATQSAMALVALMLAAITFAGVREVGAIYAMVALAAVARAFDGPARQALVVNLVPVHHVPNAVSLNGITWRLSDVTGPLIAGLLIALPLPGERGIALCYALNFLTFFAVLYTVWRLPARPPDVARLKGMREVLHSIGQGIDFVRRTPVVRNAMWIDFWATFFSSADALLPAFAGPILRLGPAGYGVLAASSAVGALLAASALAWFPPIRRQGAWVIAMVGAYGLFTILFGLSQNLVVAVIFLAGTGAADMISTVLRQTIRQLATPDEMRGRMTSVGSLFNISGPQLGDFEAGIVAKATGERLSVVLGGAACLLIAAHWGKGSPLRGYIHRAPSERP